MVVYDGQALAPYPPGNFGNLWALSLVDTSAARWDSLPLPGGGSADLPGGSAVWDSTRSEILIFGDLRPDVWSLGLAPAPSLIRVTPPYELPGPRAGHSAFFDSTTHRMIITPGSRYGSGGTVPDTWA